MSIVDDIQRFVRHFILAMIKQYEAIFFLKSHKLWRGIFNYGWLSKALMILAIVLAAKYIAVLAGWFGSTASEGLSVNSLMTLGSSSIDFWTENFGWAFSKSRKYVILILTEVITFHVVRSTIAILTNRIQDKTFNAFVKAQVRMIKVAAFSWGLELAFGMVAGMFLGFIGLDFLKPSIIFFAQCFFLGFALMDNYNEQYDMKVKESFKRTFPVAGVALGLGLVFYLLLFIPIMGAILAPSLGGVAAAILMLELEQKDEIPIYIPELKVGRK